MTSELLELNNCVKLDNFNYIRNMIKNRKVLDTQIYEYF